MIATIAIIGAVTVLMFHILPTVLLVGAPRRLVLLNKMMRNAYVVELYES